MGFGVWGLGFRVWGLGFGVWGSGGVQKVETPACGAESGREFTVFGPLNRSGILTYA